MDAERWRLTRSLFERALDLPPDERDTWLDEACDDAGLAADVRAMLAADARTDTPTSLPERVPELIVDYARHAAEARFGRRYGAWQVQRVLGEGGMGTVYLAERIEGGFTQRAALKVVRSGFAQDDLLARLASERQILAGLEHPNIARLLDGGADAQGDPFLALEYIEGVDLRTHCDGASLDVAARLRLFLTVCDAVAYAHSRLVVHRDLKPSNILVAASGELKLLDFGVAKLIDPGVAGETTVARLRLFTPEYAAPEQIAGAPTTTAVDVYSLGVLLFELLTGQRPHRANAQAAASIEHAVLHDEPSRPSTRVTGRDAQTGVACERLARHRATTPRQLRRQLRGDLDAIVLKALRKAPDDRYASVRLLADDLRAHLERRPVAARRGSTRYRLLRFTQRHALAIGFATVALVALLVGLGAALWQARAARIEAATSREALAFMQGLFEVADPEASRGRDVSARELLDRGSERIRDALVEQPVARATLLQSMARAYLGLGLDAEALPLIDDALVLAREAGDARGAQRAELARADALLGLARYQDVLDEFGPRRAGLTGTSLPDRRHAALLDYHLARAAQALGRHALAEGHYIDALHFQERTAGLTAAATQDVVGGLVALYELRDRHEEALALAQRSVDAFPHPGAPDDLERGRALAALAMVRSNIGPLAEAEALRREVLSIYRAVYGDEHTLTVGAINDLASVLFAQRRFRDVLPMFEEVLAARRRLHAPDHPSVATAANNVAFARSMIGDAAGALPLAQEALAIRETAYGHVHTSTAMSVHAVGLALLDLGRLDEAQTSFEDALHIHAELHGKDATQLITPHNNLQRIALLRDGADVDCAHGERAVALAGAREPGEDSRKHYTLALWRICRLQAGERDIAPSLQDTLDTYRRLVAPDDPYVAVLEALRDRALAIRR